jgi:putative Holliday junction resolvase
MRMMGLDYGRARIGVAISDESCRIALPLTALDARRELKQKLGELVSGREAGRIVIGYPLDRNGQPGAMGNEVREFSERLARWFGVECVLWDERYTTAQASGAARKSGSSAKKSQNDMAAATIILQSYLDSIGRQSS